MAESEDEYGFPDDFEGLDFDNIPGLQAPPNSRHESSDTPLVPPNMIMMPAGVASPVPSAGSSGVEEMDDAFLAAVDAMEARALSEIRRDSETCLNSDDAVKGVSGSLQSGESVNLNRKGKRKADSPDERDVRAVLAAYETELTCPICCDLFVGAHITNPCGHTCCGECGYGWLARNKYQPTCATCRSSLFVRNPLFPNFSVDNLVRQHLLALAKSGFPEWQEKGYKTIEWNKRLKSWNKQAVARTAKEKSKNTACLRRRPPRYYDDYTDVDPWVIEDNFMDEDENTLVTRVLRTIRPRR